MSDLFTESEPMPNALATIPQPTEGERLLTIIESAANNPDFDPSKMQALMDMKRGWDADRAAEAFANALTTFQAECPRVSKSRRAEASGKFQGYAYAAYEDIMAQVGPLLQQCGLALSFSTESHDKLIRVTLKVRHGTHVESHTLDVPIPSLSANDTQRYGAALSYAKRYALCAALNIVVADEDDDAKSCFEPISGEQALRIEELLDQHNRNKDGFKKYLKKQYGVDMIAEIRTTDYDDVVAAIMDQVRKAGHASH